MVDSKAIVDKIRRLIKSRNISEARDALQRELEKMPNQLNLLTVAIEVYRASDDREKSLEYAELLISNYPGNWIGYGSAAKDLISLQRIKEAQNKTGLKDAISVAFGKSKGKNITIASMDFSYIGGSMGSVVGEKISRAVDLIRGINLFSNKKKITATAKIIKKPVKNKVSSFSN